MTNCILLVWPSANLFTLPLSELLELLTYFQVPYIEDPETGVTLFESVEIIKYLDKTYSLRQSN